MKIILVKDYPRLGSEHDVLEVKDGYARNYLIPEGIAILATKGNIKHVEEIKKYSAKAAERKVEEAKKLAEKIAELSVTLKVNVKDGGEDIYGSVGSQEIVDALKEEGVEISRSSVMLAETIKKLGVYEIKIKLHKTVDSVLKMWIVKSED